MTERQSTPPAPAYQCGACETGYDTAAEAARCCPGCQGQRGGPPAQRQTTDLDICPDCNGCGWDNPAEGTIKCRRCGGSGGVPKTTPWRWQEHFELWLRTRPDMQRRGLTERLEEYVRLHPELAQKVNDDAR